MTNLRLHTPSYAIVRVYRKDGQYWAYKLTGYPANVLHLIQQVQAWADGLSVHPQFECVTFEGVGVVTGETTETFASAAPALVKFLNGETSDNHSR